MSLNVMIPPKAAAIDAAIAAQARASPTDTLVLHVYCDGSYKQGSYVKRTRPRAGIGIVANIWLPRDTTKQRTSKACFIRCYRDDDNTTTEALALAEGAHVALQQISRIEILSPIRSTDRIEVIFWSDSTTVLRALEDRTRFQAQSKKTRHLLDIVKLKTYELQDLRADVSIIFRWCPQECVEPHETADDLSKQVRLSGGSTPSKAEELFKSGPHSSIESALRKRLESAENPLLPEQTLQQDADEQIGPHASSSGHPDPYAFIEMAALELPIQHKDVVLAAIELQKKVNAARSQDAPQGQVHEPKDEDFVPRVESTSLMTKLKSPSASSTRPRSKTTKLLAALTALTLSHMSPRVNPVSMTVTSTTMRVYLESLRHWLTRITVDLAIQSVKMTSSEATRTTMWMMSPR